jgi:hypothetical protein
MSIFDEGIKGERGTVRRSQLEVGDIPKRLVMKGKNRLLMAVELVDTQADVDIGAAPVDISSVLLCTPSGWDLLRYPT